MTVQILQANGCRVLGIDTDPARVKLAGLLGADTVDLSIGEDPIAAAVAFSRGRGVDGVIVTASTRSSTPIMQAAEMCRMRGRIVMVGVTGLELDRTPFYLKEITLQVSCSYGPGRYDSNYEDRGHDYPVGYVRWTEQRNFEAVLDMMAAETLRVEDLITHRFPIAEAPAAYDLLAADRSALGIVLQYPGEAVDCLRTVAVRRPSKVVREHRSDCPRVAVIGAGNYARRTLVPALVRTPAVLHTVVSSGGMSASQVGNRFGFISASTDAQAAIVDPEVDAVVIATRHESHAELVLRALGAGKHVFVEKPLALTIGELLEIERVFRAIPDEERPVLAVGFNRRFSPLTIAARKAIRAASEPSMFICTVNAGAIPTDHWTQDALVGGGRLIGEGCHFIDLMRYLAASPLTEASVTMMGDAPGVAVRDDKTTVTLVFEDGTVGTLHYFANGHSSYPKERLEVFNGGRVLSIDNFRSLRSWGWRGLDRPRVRGQDKGHAAFAASFIDAIRTGGPPPIPFDEILEVSRCAVELARLRNGTWRPTRP
jgi:predicted dehydrogenase